MDTDQRMPAGLKRGCAVALLANRLPQSGQFCPALHALKECVGLRLYRLIYRLAINFRSKHLTIPADLAGHAYSNMTMAPDNGRRSSKASQC